jgi:hypothetical protein
MSLAHTSTRGVWAMRLTLPERLLVMTSSLPPSATHQTGVSTPSPFLRKVRTAMCHLLPSWVNEASAWGEIGLDSVIDSLLSASARAGAVLAPGSAVQIERGPDPV